MSPKTEALPFKNLSWFRLQVKLVNIRKTAAAKAHPFSVCQAIIKAVNDLTFPKTSPETEPPVFFHLPGKKHTFSIREGSIIPLQVFFLRTELEIVKRWIEKFRWYFAEGASQNNFEIAGMGEPECRRYEDVAAELSISKTAGEIALEFLTPLPFNPQKKSNRTYLDKEQFIHLLEKRFDKLFDDKIHYDPAGDSFEILPYYWKYTHLKHPSHSQPGSTQFIKGCFGPLYIKGSFQLFLPFLILGSELHAGTKLSNSQGYYRLIENPPGYFSQFFPNRQALVSVIKDVLARYDEPAYSPRSAERLLYSESEYAEQLYTELAENSYQPQPHSAFKIKKKDGSERIVEQVSTKDYIVQQYLHRTIYRPFDRFFEEGSIGYRKGISREKTVRMVQEAIAEGYQFVIESDIEDFFPSVDLEALQKLLEFYLPQQDILIKDLLLKCIRAGFVLGGKHLEREKGLAQGSPLSPLLANLYLDAFDEKASEWGVRMIRYADDFIILARSLGEADGILSKTESYLSEIGLKIKKEKTAIRPVSEGFHFLGIQFEKSAAKIEPEEAIKRLRKPLYITEPFVFLALNGGAVDIHKNRRVIETIPLRRISEIIVMERASFSTALIRYCVEHSVPITIALETGYFITTIKPDSKKYYETSAAHARKFYALSDTELLALAKEFAAHKLLNYLPLFSQRYSKGTNEITGELEQYSDRIYQASTLEEVRGLEGIAARNIYQWLNIFIDDRRFHIQKRRRKPPDRINSLLNYGYYLLFTRLNAMMRSVGLNPYLGFLHSPEDNYESLVSDLVELFRAHIDRFILRILNLKVVGFDDYVLSSRGMYLKRDAAKKYLKQFEAELERISGTQKLSLKERMYMQVIVFRNWVLEQGSLKLYRWPAYAEPKELRSGEGRPASPNPDWSGAGREE